MMEPITLVSRSYRELMSYIQIRICEMDDVDMLENKLFLIGALSALEQLHEKEVHDAHDTYCTDETCETFLHDLNCERCTK